MLASPRYLVCAVIASLTLGSHARAGAESTPVWLDQYREPAATAAAVRRERNRTTTMARHYSEARHFDVCSADL